MLLLSGTRRGGEGCGLRRERRQKSVGGVSGSKQSSAQRAGGLQGISETSGRQRGSGVWDGPETRQ
eukprot:788764-Rhodomonas_salina.2